MVVANGAATNAAEPTRGQLFGLHRRIGSDAFWPPTRRCQCTRTVNLLPATNLRRGVETLAATESIDRAKPHVEPVFEAAFKRTKFNQSCIWLARIDRRIDGLGCILLPCPLILLTYVPVLSSPGTCTGYLAGCCRRSTTRAILGGRAVNSFVRKYLSKYLQYTFTAPVSVRP